VSIVVVLTFRCMHLHPENFCSPAYLLAALQRKNLPFVQTAHEWRRSQSFRLSGNFRSAYHQVEQATSLASRKAKVARDQFWMFRRAVILVMKIRLLRCKHVSWSIAHSEQGRCFFSDFALDRGTRQVRRGSDILPVG
jgi:hypothetical protein